MDWELDVKQMAVYEQANVLQYIKIRTKEDNGNDVSIVHVVREISLPCSFVMRVIHGPWDNTRHAVVLTISDVGTNEWQRHTPRSIITQ